MASGSAAPFSIRQDGGAWAVEAAGAWRVAGAGRIDAALRKLVAEAKGAEAASVSLRLGAVEALDTAGAWLLLRTRDDLRKEGIDALIEGASGAQAQLLAAVGKAPAPLPPPARPSPLRRLVEGTGAATLGGLDEAKALTTFLGAVVAGFGRLVLDPRRFRLTSFAHHVEEAGIKALPIVGLLSFLIGIVLAYQSVGQLRQFGAEIFTIDLLGISVLRELGPLLTAIIVAGRSGSAFTAQIGAMQAGEEVDAMRVIGLDPIEVLVLPRLAALVVALPLLAFFAGLMALLGGGAVIVLDLGIALPQFLAQLQAAVPLGVFVAGTIKAPVFAFLIALVGCHEGLKVEGSAESVGRLTTRSVVVGIFLVIVADAAFSVLFQAFGV